MKFLLLITGSTLGVSLRYFFQLFFKTSFTSILASNLLGCFLVGLLCFIKNENLKIFFITAFLGSLTTFSSFILVTDEYLQKDGTKFLLFLLFHLIFGYTLFKIGKFFSSYIF